MEKYQNKYRIASARAPFWNYGWSAAYFITICTHHRLCWFGRVGDGEMILSEIGEIVKTEWLKTFEMRPDMNLYMGEYVVMPNHFHAIIGIGENQYNTQNDMENTTLNQFGPQSKNLASIVRGFKIGVTKNARVVQPDLAWQTRYHDYIIRNEQSYQTIAAYIINNPAQWTADKFYIS